jgi:sodium-dependent phosphate transporter
MKGLIAFPFFAWLTGSLIAMLLVWKGGDYEVNLTNDQLPGVIVAAGAAFGLLIALFLVPWIYRLVIKEDWQLKWFHVFMGLLLLRRGEVPPAPADYKGPIKNFYEGHLTAEELEAKRARDHAERTQDAETGHANTEVEGKLADPASSDSGVDALPNEAPPRKSLVGPKPDLPIYHPKFLFWAVKFALLRGVDIDIVASQKSDSVISGDVDEINSRARHYDNQTEFLYTFLQIMTACTASFVHGANDVANAVGPYATVFQVWQEGRVPEKSNVPIWILAFGGIAIAIGLWTYGYHIMRNLGNR